MQTGGLRLPTVSAGWLGHFHGPRPATFLFVHPALSALIQRQAKEATRPSRDEASL